MVILAELVVFVSVSSPYLALPAMSCQRGHVRCRHLWQRLIVLLPHEQYGLWGGFFMLFSLLLFFFFIFAPAILF